MPNHVIVAEKMSALWMVNVWQNQLYTKQMSAVTTQILSKPMLDKQKALSKRDSVDTNILSKIPMPLPQHSQHTFGNAKIQT